MRRIKGKFQPYSRVVAAIFMIAVMWPASGLADTAEAPSIAISQLKITSSNGQFVTLYNATDATLDMSGYQVEYFNNYDLQKATSSKIIGLSGTVPPHSYFTLSDDTLSLCYRLTVQSHTLGFSSSSGTIEILALNQSDDAYPAAPVLQDIVNWSKTDSGQAQTLPSNPDSFLQRLPLDDANNPTINAPGAGSWQEVSPDPNAACSLVGIGGSSEETATMSAQPLLAPGEPPAIILSDNKQAVSGSGQAHMPAADIGLMAPKITEMLPNPAGTGTDSTNEFIELYNPNASAFDLSGFMLEAGTSSVHSYVFPNGTLLPPRAFKAVYSASTHLSLSNTKGQVGLLDPFSRSLSTTATYSNAKDGIAWALAKGKWYWTTKPTPGAANVIKQPPTSKKGAKKSSSKKSKLGAAAQGVNTATGSTVLAAGQPEGSVGRAPLHRRILALVAVAAILYLAYEYRTDMANKLFQFRRYLAHRRSSGQQT